MTPNRRSYTVLAIGLVVALATTALAQQIAAPIGAQAVVQDMASDKVAKPRVGQAVDVNLLHRICRPGLYGISQSPTGSSYGVLDGRLIRYDTETLRVQSVIREVDDILD